MAPILSASKVAAWRRFSSVESPAARIPASGRPAGQRGVGAVLMQAGRPVSEERLNFVIE